MDPGRRALAGTVAAVLLVLLLPLSATAHSDLERSDPAQGTTVPSPFVGPVVLTFSEALADGSKADLIGPDGTTVATATIDAAATMMFSPASALAPGAYQVEWTSIADEGDLLRGNLAFSVTAATSAEVAATPGPTPASSNGTGGEVVLPIVIALILAAAGAFYLVRRNRPA
jgi:methionine-rich copper-binding protein CopC